MIFVYENVTMLCKIRFKFMNEKKVSSSVCINHTWQQFRFDEALMSKLRSERKCKITNRKVPEMSSDETHKLISLTNFHMNHNCLRLSIFPLFSFTWYFIQVNFVLSSLSEHVTCQEAHEDEAKFALLFIIVQTRQ